MDIILPVYNSAPIVDQVVEAVRLYVAKHPHDCGIFVDDGSSDGTADLLAQLIEQDSQLTLIRQPQNLGKGGAIHRGIEACTCEHICFVDGDLAYSLDHLDVLREKLNTSDVVIGSRHLVDSPQLNITWLRRAMGGTFNWYVRTLLGLPFRDTQAGLKGFRLKVANDLFSRQRLTRFAFDAELLYIAKSLGYSISEIPATVSDQHSYRDSTVKLVRDPLRMFWSVLRIRLNALIGRYGSAHSPELRRRGV